ncbi:MAG: family NAD(P)-dependent oxidoreductase [Mucilaginibacter sp.]|nr:family NAD(P)-dependent oxidoreductase [Mucilaginibacter sp.]
MLINNAGSAVPYTLGINADSAHKAVGEFETNFFSAIRLIDELLPLLSKSAEGIIVNVTSIVALVPKSTLPTYSASKAALHAYTELLRHALSKNTSIKVFELMPPLVNTEFSSTIGGENGIPPKDVADSLLAAIESNIYEVHTGNTAGIYQLSRATTYNDAFKMVNK